MIHRVLPFCLLLLVLCITACSAKGPPAGVSEPDDGASTTLQPGSDRSVDSAAPTRPRLESLMSTASDFDLCDGVFLKIGDRYDHMISADAYTSEERTVMLVWHAGGIIDNGGFEYLFSGDFPGDPSYRLTAQAFETLGCERATTAFHEALSLFPNAQAPEGTEVRYETYKHVPEARRQEVNHKFWSAGWDHEIERKLADYIRVHRSAFTHLK